MPASKASPMNRESGVVLITKKYGWKLHLALKRSCEILVPNHMERQIKSGRNKLGMITFTPRIASLFGLRFAFSLSARMAASPHKITRKFTRGV